MSADFEGHQPRECGGHRTVGEHRAWCHECGEWCYPGDPRDLGCKGCRLGLPDRLTVVVVKNDAAQLLPWRVGRTVGRTVYVQLGDDPAKGDVLLGVMDTPELAALVVKSVNEYLGTTKGGSPEEAPLADTSAELTDAARAGGALGPPPPGDDPISGS